MPFQNCRSSVIEFTDEKRKQRIILFKYQYHTKKYIFHYIKVLEHTKLNKNEDQPGMAVNTNQTVYFI